MVFYKDGSQLRASSRAKRGVWALVCAGLLTGAGTGTYKPLLGQPAQFDSHENASKLLKADEEAAIDELLINGERFRNAHFGKVSKSARPAKPFNPPNVMRMGPDDVLNPIDPSDPNEPFPTDPTDPTDPGNYGGGWDDSVFPTGIGFKNGGAEKVAMMVLYETLNFYGVVHYVEKVNTRVDFKIIKSTSGYFTDLTKLDVAYAIREFGRYLRAQLCNDPSMENFYKMFAQVPAEEIGLRFKYDMAWALLGNALPKEPNQIMKLSTRWTALQQLLNATSMTHIEDQQRAKEYKSWIGNLSDLVKMMTTLNKLYCLVDVRPVPKDELKKRVVVHKLLDFGKELEAKYGPYKEILDQMKKDGQSAQVDSLRKD